MRNFISSPIPGGFFLALEGCYVFLSGMAASAGPSVNVLSDGAFRYGVKCGLAGVAAVYIALLIRLDNPTWALFTVFVLMMAQYVGAVAEKSIFRFVGTIIGGVLGFVLTGSLEQSPLIFLTLVGCIVAGCTAMFGQSRYPYAFLLCGMTLLVVVSNGIGNPEQSWMPMLSRIEEVSLGILVTLVVQSVLWPRYARAEFHRDMRESFADLKACFLECPGIAPAGSGASGAVRSAGFPARITALRGLLEFGARESQYFRDRLATYFELTGCLAKIANAIATLREPLPAESLYRKEAGAEIDALQRAIARALDDLCDAKSTAASRAQCRRAVNQIFEALESKLELLRKDPRLKSVAIGQVLILGMHSLALDEIRAAIARSHELIDSLPEDALTISYDLQPLISQMPPARWVRSGIKGGLALVVALILDNWLHPPGGPMFVLGTWIFTGMNQASPGGQGDRKAFHYVTLFIVVLVPLCLVVLAGRPLLSSYAVMNAVLFTWLFVWGYLSFSTRGVTQPMNFGMLCIVGILGLNGQEPISFQAVMGFFFGLSFAVVVAAVIQRALWPSLPQWEARDRFVELAEICRDLIRKGTGAIPLWRLTRLALIPGEAELRIRLLQPPTCPEGERDRLIEVLQTLSGASGHLVVTLGRLLPIVPLEFREEAGGRIARLEQLMDAILSEVLTAFETGASRAASGGDLRAALDEWVGWVGCLRLAMLAEEASPIVLLRILGLAERYKLAGEQLMAAQIQTSSLRLPLYMGDFSL